LSNKVNYCKLNINAR